MRPRFRVWRPWSRSAWPRGQGLFAARRGVAAVEFALTTPVLIFLLFGMYDLSMGWITWQRLETAANSVGQVATALAVQPGGINWLHVTPAWQAATAINAAMPETNLPGARYAVVLTEILFTPDLRCPLTQLGTPSFCVANVLWSTVALSQGNTGLQRRQCGHPDSQSNLLPPNQSKLPESLFKENPTGTNPILVVDVTYTFTPLFLSGLLGSFPMNYTVYYPARVGDLPLGVDQAIAYGDIVDANGKLLPQADVYCLPLPIIPSTPS